MGGNYFDRNLADKIPPLQLNLAIFSRLWLKPIFNAWSFPASVGFTHTPAILVTALAFVNRCRLYRRSQRRLADQAITLKGKVAGGGRVGVFSFVWQPESHQN